MNVLDDRAALVRGICAEPWDDVRRLALADWLEENAGRCEGCDAKGTERYTDAAGDRDTCECSYCYGTGTDGRAERAEYIRLGVELAKLGDITRTPPSESNDREQDRVEARSKELARREWWGPVFEDRSIKATVRRGFVSEMRLTLAKFAGEPCWLCRGGAAKDPTGLTRCPNCLGDGFVGGVAEQLFRDHPITRVVLTDREPYHNGAGYSWFLDERERKNDSVPQAAELPKKLFDLLPHALKFRFAAFNTREFALKALFDVAAPNYGRILVGLDPYPSNVETGVA